MQEIQRCRQNWVDFADPKSDINRLLMVTYTQGMQEKPMLWWEKLKRIPDLKVLNLVRERKETLKALELFDGVCGLYPGFTDFDASAVPKSVHLTLNPWVTTREEARRTAEYFGEYGKLPGT